MTRVAGSGFDIDLFVDILPELLEGASLTLELTAASVLIGTLIGLFVGMGRISHFKIINVPATLYVEFIRGTPLLVQIMIIYYGLPALGLNLGQMTSGIVALSINSGAYVGEIFKAGIKSIKKGQTEASISLGLNYVQTMRHVILPQATRNILPALGNEFIALLKDSSLVSVIAISELLRRGMLVYSRTYDAWTPLLGVAFVYICMTIPLSRVVQFMEKRWEIND